MADENEDWLGLVNPAELDAQNPGVVLPEKMGGHELRLMDRVHMDGASDEFIGKVHKWATKDKDGKDHWHHDVSRAIFTTGADPKTGEDIPEQWDSHLKILEPEIERHRRGLIEQRRINLCSL